MKLGTFLLGGIAGAAAVVYLNRKSKSMLFSAFSSSNNSMGRMMDKVDKAKDSFMSKSHEANSAKAFNSAPPASGGLDQVEKIVKDDAHLKSTVNEILNENKMNSTAFQ
ncbi:hypothetical protein [Paenibacillus whitsoniae]|uniref:Uncharacterized protein n=1 Tax=Paenibacillus whitsoniae TaxID=2496558 RepID=A0A430JHH1_9BACL|nr:hypothetical protein [Paenibacillus whitsoniae]RTE10488.1 hypothetical protein EJQ19_07430 [Paenibacillus whitsoniae]